MEERKMLPIVRTRKSWPSLVDEFLSNDFMPGFINWDDRSDIPAVNVYEGKDDFRIEVAAPGLNKGDFKVNLDNNTLTISSEKEYKNEEKEEKVMRREFSYSKFSRSFNLPESVIGEKISASHKNGVLTVSIPKKEEMKVKPIREIKIA